MAAVHPTPTAAVPTGPIEDVTHNPHTTSQKLEDQAATAALYVTIHDKTHGKTGYEFLDKDNKLSSAGAAASLKYANPQDLPSYPSSGLKKNDSAAGAAASLGWANQKPFEHWKPDPSASASAAAVLAKDYKMAPLWQPEQSANGAKAALLAHRDGGKVDISQPEPSVWGESAASQAFKKFGAGTLSPVLDYGYTALGRQGSLQAATGAMAQGRKRADSTPIVVAKPETYPDEANALKNALSAATSASKQGKRTETPTEGGSVPYTTMSRDMYTSHPPVAPEVEERNRNDTLRASAVAMAQGMYNHQQAQFAATSQAQSGAIFAHGRYPSSSTISEEVQPMRFNNLQEAAQKLAQERLAKLHDEYAKAREYREYYGGNDKYTPGTNQPSYKLSMRGRTRNRSSSDGRMDEDREQSNKIRAQMSLFSSNLSQVDEKKRQKDREDLIAVAQRNVTKSLHGMDERVFAETGHVAPSLLNEWEVKAHAAAQAKSDSRMENHGKVHIGGGKFIDQSAIDAVAARNVQPVLDEINEKADAEHERQAALKLEQETQARKAAEKKQREKESKQINKKLKQQDKEEERAAKKENRKSAKSEVAPVAAESDVEPAVASGAVAEPAGEEPETVAERRDATPVAPLRTSMEDQASLRIAENASAANGEDVTPLSPTSSSNGKVKNWLKSRFSRRSSKSMKSSGDKGKEEGFVGGAALTGASANNSTASLGVNNSSAREAAASTGKAKEEIIGPVSPVEPVSGPTVDHDTEPEVEGEEERIGRPAHRASDVSSMEPVEKRETADDDEFQEARDNFDEDLAPPPTFPAEKSSSPVRDSKFIEAV